MRINWQNISDDLYAHQYRVLSTVGKCSTGVAILCMASLLGLLIFHIGSEAVHTLMFLGCLMLLGFGIAFSTHPFSVINRHTIRYRYPVFLDITKNSAKMICNWLSDQNIIHSYVGSSELGVHFSEFRLTRLEDMMLVKMRF